MADSIYPTTPQDHKGKRSKINIDVEHIVIEALAPLNSFSRLLSNSGYIGRPDDAGDTAEQIGDVLSVLTPHCYKKLFEDLTQALEGQNG